MALFPPQDTERIGEEIRNGSGNVLITFRNSHGPTALEKLWNELMREFGNVRRCLSWWSGNGNIGLIECDLDDGVSVFGQWALADQTGLVGIFRVSDEEVRGIRDGFDAGNVTSAAMRAIRIGESQDRD
ncbi:MAG: hypothetical protein HXY34_10680 [Candidatus Thorarchaeota archaeon]|nr:hypothetical protein [Candidatus Thorarchaeota archaeon]